MGKKRDVIAEILAKRTRLARRADRYRQFNERHDSILEAADLLASRKYPDSDARRELLKYIPIAVVACWEAYFRLVIRDLIDSGSPYRENASALEVGKFDVEAVTAIGGKRVTAGELISHQLRINNFDDINSHLSKLMGTDFKQSLEATVDPFEKQPLGETTDLIIRDVQNTFEHRHIFCHELALGMGMKVASAKHYTGLSLVFTYHTEVVIGGLIGSQEVKRRESTVAPD